MGVESRDGNAAELWFTPDLSAYTPTGLRAKSDGKKVFFAWDHVIVEGVMRKEMVGYRIYHSTDGSTYAVIANLSRNFPRAMTFFADLDPGTHYFKVATMFKHEYQSPLSTAVSVVHKERYGT